MNKYFITEDWCVRFKKENNEIHSDIGTIVILDLYFLKHPEHVRISKDKSGWILKDFSEKYTRYRGEIIANENCIFKFETDEEALLLYEVM